MRRLLQTPAHVDSFPTHLSLRHGARGQSAYPLISRFPRRARSALPMYHRRRLLDRMRTGFLATALCVMTLAARSTQPDPHHAHASASASSQSRASATSTRTVWDGVYTAAQQKRGEPVYVKDCSTCHGETLKGGEGSPPLSGPEFTAKWNGRTVGDLFDMIRLTMPPPPDTPGRLTPQQNADVVAYMLGANGFPAGNAAELPAESEQLKRI